MSARTEAEILEEVIAPDHGDLPLEAARSILQWNFSDHATSRMRALVDRNNQGTITPDEEAELDRYRRVGLLLDLVQAKARVSLKRAETA